MKYIKLFDARVLEDHTEFLIEMNELICRIWKGDLRHSNLINTLTDFPVLYVSFPLSDLFGEIRKLPIKKLEKNASLEKIFTMVDDNDDRWFDSKISTWDNSLFFKLDAFPAAIEKNVERNGMKIHDNIFFYENVTEDDTIEPIVFILLIFKRDMQNQNLHRGNISTKKFGM